MARTQQTKNCIVCLKKEATIHSGHVIKGKKKIIAGWCVDCHKLDRDYELQGFLGQYVNRMGIKDW